MGGPGPPKPGRKPPLHIKNQSMAEGQYLRPLHTAPMWGLSASATAQAVRAFPPPKQVVSRVSNDKTGATMRPQELAAAMSGDLPVSLREALGTFRNSVEGALRELERDVHRFESPRSLTCLGKSLRANARNDAKSKEAVEEENEEQDAERLWEVDEERKVHVQFGCIPDTHRVSRLSDLVNKGTVPSHISAHTPGHSSQERMQVALSSTRVTDYETAKRIHSPVNTCSQMANVDNCVLDLPLEPPQKPREDELSKLPFNASRISTQDSCWRTFANSTRYSIVRGVAVMIDAALVIFETWLSTEAVASRDVVPRLQALLYPSLIICTFFIFDMISALALEFPRCNLFVGQAGLRSVDLAATLQQALVIIGMLNFPEQRFTSLFRAVVHQFSFLRVLRALATLCGMGGMRIQQSFGELYIMIHALAGAVRPLAWCTLMCGCILIVFGLIIAESTATRISRHFPPTEVFSEDSAQALLLSDWGGTGRCVYSLLMTMLGGTDWGYLLETLVGFGDAAFSMICFIVFICFTFIALLNTITAVFIQCAFTRLEKDRVFAMHQEAQQKQEYLLAAKEAFENMTGDCNGRALQEDMVLYLQDPEARAAFQKLHLDTDQVEKVFLLMGGNGADGITLQEFVTGCLQLRGAASSVHLELLHQDLKCAIHTLADMMMLLQNQTKIITTPCFGSESPSSNQEDQDAQQLGTVQQGRAEEELALYSDQLSELDITVQE